MVVLVFVHNSLPHMQYCAIFTSISNIGMCSTMVMCSTYGKVHCSSINGTCFLSHFEPFYVGVVVFAHKSLPHVQYCAIFTSVSTMAMCSSYGQVH